MIIVKIITLALGLDFYCLDTSFIFEGNTVSLTVSRQIIKKGAGMSNTPSESVCLSS